MITEVAILIIDPTRAGEFEETYRDKKHILQRQPGYLGETLMRAIENPGQYLLQVEWDTVADHERFIAAPDYPDLDGALGAYVLDGSFYHYTLAV